MSLSHYPRCASNFQLLNTGGFRLIEQSHYLRCTSNSQLFTQAGSGLLSTRRGAVDLNEPDPQLLVHHEVEAKELEALVREVPGADGRLHTQEAAPVK